MKKKTLSETNPYLKDPAKRQAMIARAVISSSAIEGVRKPAVIATTIRKKDLSTFSRKSAKSAK
ncbi:MAG: hypothetical protein HY036_09430 [Nitrospirae bacterium]|nr:hypothetical protein [Nitrospirota bacterium]MBI3352785.1 hypothetical protein [Nitrospirota bacterium]